MREPAYTMFITNNHVSFHLWWKETCVKHQKVSKYHEYVWGIKFQLSLKILIFWENIPKKSIYGQKQKKWTSPLSLHIRISLATKFQLKLTIMIFWTKLAQQDCFQSKTEKNSNTIKFCIFELLSVPGFSINWQLWLFGPNLPKKSISCLKWKKWTPYKISAYNFDFFRPNFPEKCIPGLRQKKTATPLNCAYSN